MLSGNIFITGGAGFLGRGIMRQAQREKWPCQFLIASRDEMKLMRAATKYPARYVVCDVTDLQRMSLLMRGMDYVIHAAAAKHIPVCEMQPSEAMRVNLDGSRCVIDAACEAGVDRVVLISTDKACEPINTYGCTKMLVERLVFESDEFQHPHGTKLVGTRYGNIVGSTGSVWWAFKDQIARDGRLTLTEGAMTRYYWSVDEAVDLIEAAIAGPSATVIVPELKSIRLDVLADYLTEHLNLKPYEQVGRRPGEKTHEMLLSPTEVNRTLLWAHEGRAYWTLYGPTKNVKGTKPLVNAVSDLAEPLTPEVFVMMAEDSESV